MLAVPTYLRFIVAITSGVTAYFAYSILTLGIATASGHKEVSGGLGALLSLGAFVVTLIVALAVSDWIRNRYPRGSKQAASQDSVTN